MRKLYAMLNLVELKRQITRLQDKLLGIALLKESIREQKSLNSNGDEQRGCRSNGKKLRELK